MRTQTRKPLLIIRITLAIVCILLLVFVYFAPSYHQHPVKPYYPHVKPEGTLIASFENVRGDHVDIYQNQNHNGGWVDSWSNDTSYKPLIISFCHGLYVYKKRLMIFMAR